MAFRVTVKVGEVRSVLERKFETFEDAREHAAIPAIDGRTSPLIVEDRSEGRSFDPHSDANPLGMNWNAVDVSSESYDFCAESYDVDDSGKGWAYVFPDFEGMDPATLTAWAKDRGLELGDPENEDGDTIADLEGQIVDHDQDGEAGYVETLQTAIRDFEPSEDWTEDAARKCVDACQDDPSVYEPCMSIRWPLPNLHYSPEGAQSILECDVGHLRPGCVIVTLIDGEPFLALAGGGMDCSDQIVAAYIALGYYPPAALRLPTFAGSGRTAESRHRWQVLILASRQAQSALAGWCASRIEALDRLERALLEDGEG